MSDYHDLCDHSATIMRLAKGMHGVICKLATAKAGRPCEPIKLANLENMLMICGNIGQVCALEPLERADPETFAALGLAESYRKALGVYLGAVEALKEGSVDGGTN